MGATDRTARRRGVRRGSRGRRVVPRGRLRLTLLSRFSGRVVRQTGLDTPAFPPSRPAPTEARYHRPGDPWPLYASLDEPTAWSEWLAATRGSVDPAGERRRLWQLDVSDLAVVDLRRPEVAEELGIRPDSLVGPRRAAHRLAAVARARGAEGLVVPSAARPAAWNLVVFPESFAKVRVRASRAARPRPPA